MFARTRRRFLTEVGRGVLSASLGCGLARELGLLGTRTKEDREDAALTFGKLEPLVALMQETKIEQLLPTVVAKLRGGTTLTELTAAGALANARSFGGENYIGFHTMMALAPAFRMAALLPEDRRPLPVLKVLYRNTSNIQDKGGRKTEVLRQVTPGTLRKGQESALLLRDAVRRRDLVGAEQTFAALAAGSPAQAFDDLLVTVQDATEVHRVVLPFRAWDLLEVIGRDHAHTLLRQSLRYCLRSENDAQPARYRTSRTLLPRLLDQHRLLAGKLGSKQPDDSWLEQMIRTIFESSPEVAADAAAAALAEGIAPAVLGEAISLAANQLVLRDHGRREKEVQPGKPLGSVHGDSIGVHACDSAHAWRQMAAAASPRNACACLILGAYQVAFDRIDRGGDFLGWEALPHVDASEKLRGKKGPELLVVAEAAIRAGDQAQACAAVHAYGEAGLAPAPVFELLLGFAISEDGALHAEKYFGTVQEEFATTRDRFRWRQLVGLARVTASEFGVPAPGYQQALEVLKT